MRICVHEANGCATPQKPRARTVQHPVWPRTSLAEVAGLWCSAKQSFQICEVSCSSLFKFQW